MTSKAEQTVGVIGGMGPKATLDFYAKLIQRTQAETDQDHLHVIINSNAKVPNRQNALSGKGPSCAPELIQAARALESAGADFMVMVCNTAHAYEDHIRAEINVPFISIIRENVIHCLNLVPNLRKVGILGATGCLDNKLYQDQFDKAGVDCTILNPDDQNRFMKLMYQIKANNLDFSVGMEMEQLAQKLVNDGAEIILAACTEIPLVLQKEFVSVPLVNSTDVLVESVINHARPVDKLESKRYVYSMHKEGFLPRSQVVST